jgi:hypothetical protein
MVVKEFERLKSFAEERKRVVRDRARRWFLTGEFVGGKEEMREVGTGAGKLRSRRR